MRGPEDTFFGVQFIPSICGYDGIPTQQRWFTQDGIMPKGESLDDYNVLPHILPTATHESRRQNWSEGGWMYQKENTLNWGYVTSDYRLLAGVEAVSFEKGMVIGSMHHVAWTLSSEPSGSLLKVGVNFQKRLGLSTKPPMICPFFPALTDTSSTWLWMAPA
ncbi:hypothetical protein BDV26DRAFT_83419 [Aspergillus bertholletiae]|uniref:Uncharacterized protein n=1 Tax=Aspergillus bertholletiae TaxID=1226010 RepID=A0A5N7ASX2_9EURO|nr:hypothetical protein BDV26DRAFT_83419 [Aspergillus bertholletiae]